MEDASAQYYLRAEAVNLGHSVYDTQDISTIRGGSFIINDVMSVIGRSIEELSLISTGASIGLYRILSGDPLDVEKRVWEIIDKETQGHATFVTAVQERVKGMTFKQVQEKLLAKCRWSQWKRLTLPWNEEEWTSNNRGPCHIDGIRPVLNPEGGDQHSASVLFRRQHGRKLRTGIYERIGLQKPANRGFVNNFKDLSNDSNRGDLNGMIAFIYADGNKFTKIRDRFCHRPGLSFKDEVDHLKQFDHTLQKEFRARFLQSVVDMMKDDGFGSEIRLETLLWGGDEFELVVPAWWGWRVLRMLYEKTPQVSLPVNGSSIPLTHGGGVVFCRHKSPILQVRRIARELAEMAKQRLDGIPGSHEQGNLFHYMVLRSFDLIEGQTEAFVKKRYHPALPEDLLVYGSELERLTKNMATIKKSFPRSRVYEIVDAVKHGCSPAPMLKRGLSMCPDDTKKAVESALNFLVAERPGNWFKIADLWDFIIEE